MYTFFSLLYLDGNDPIVNVPQSACDLGHCNDLENLGELDPRFESKRFSFPLSDSECTTDCPVALMGTFNLLAV